MLERVLEPEVMDTPEEAIDYDRMDHSHVNKVFVDDFLSALTQAFARPTRPWQIFDAGTGTAQIPIELMRRGIAAKILAADLASQMLIVAKENVARAGLESSIEPVIRDCKKLPEADAVFDAIMSNSIIHHIPEPQRVFDELWRVLRPGGILFIRDLCRPNDIDTLNHLVQTYAGDANAHQQQMFRESLHAALSVAEVREMITQLDISAESIQTTSDRHWTLQYVKP